MNTLEDVVLCGLAVAGAVALSGWFHLGFIGVLIAVGLAGWLIQRREHKVKEQARELLRLKLLENSGGFY